MPPPGFELPKDSLSLVFRLPARCARGNGDSSIFGRVRQLPEWKSRGKAMLPPGFEPEEDGRLASLGRCDFQDSNRGRVAHLRLANMLAAKGCRLPDLNFRKTRFRSSFDFPLAALAGTGTARSSVESDSFPSGNRAEKPCRLPDLNQRKTVASLRSGAATSRIQIAVGLHICGSRICSPQKDAASRI